MNATLHEARLSREAAIVERGRDKETMSAIRYESYGPLEALALRRARVPDLKPNSLLVRVHAAGLHIADCFAARGVPLLIRVETGLFRPHPGIPGFDFAGQVEAVGSRMTRNSERQAGALAPTTSSAREEHVVPKARRSSLINGDAGGVGTRAIHIAKLLSAEVTGMSRYRGRAKERGGQDPAFRHACIPLIRRIVTG